MATKDLSEITEIPKPPEEEVARAAKDGARIVAYDPDQLQAFIEGRITLGDLEGISKDSQYQMARVGFEFMNEGKLDGAHSVFLGLVALDPYDAYFHSALGAIAQRRDQLEEAEQHYTRALEINPFFASALANRGEVRLAFGKLELAIDDLLKALQEDPDAKEPSTQRARALLNTIRGQLEAAQKDPEEALKAAKEELEASGAPVPPRSKPRGRGRARRAVARKKKKKRKVRKKLR